MCHHIRIPLSADDKAAARRMSGLLIPVYAAIMLAVIGVVAVGSGPRPTEMIASRSVPAPHVPVP